MQHTTSLCHQSIGKFWSSIRCPVCLAQYRYLNSVKHALFIFFCSHTRRKVVLNLIGGILYIFIGIIFLLALVCTALLHGCFFLHQSLRTPVDFYRRFCISRTIPCSLTITLGMLSWVWYAFYWAQCICSCTFVVCWVRSSSSSPTHKAIERTWSSCLVFDTHPIVLNNRYMGSLATTVGDGTQAVHTGALLVSSSFIIAQYRKSLTN